MMCLTNLASSNSIIESSMQVSVFFFHAEYVRKNQTFCLFKLAKVAATVDQLFEVQQRQVGLVLYLEVPPFVCTLRSQVQPVTKIFVLYSQLVVVLHRLVVRGTHLQQLLSQLHVRKQDVFYHCN